MYVYIYIWRRLAHYGKPGRSPGAPAREPGSSRLTSRSVARRTGAEPRRVPWWLALVRLGGLPGWSDPLDLDRVPARGGTFCKADWAPRARNPNFVCHTSAAECNQKMKPQNCESWVPRRMVSRPVDHLACRFESTSIRVSQNIKNHWFLTLSKQN